MLSMHEVTLNPLCCAGAPPGSPRSGRSPEARAAERRAWRAVWWVSFFFFLLLLIFLFYLPILRLNSLSKEEEEEENAYQTRPDQIYV
jgi:flagellar biosynthesis/type III secretory pathway M-ring protein FliF/YscJ